jgi:hypothetical protein
LARLAGPLEGTTEVLLIFRADNEDEIDEHLQADPWTQSGILSTARIGTYGSARSGRARPQSMDLHPTSRSSSQLAFQSRQYSSPRC